MDEKLLKLDPGKGEFWLNELKILAESRPG